MDTTIKSNRIKGILCIIASACGFAVMSAFIKLSGDLPSVQKTFFRNLVAALIALYLIIKHKGSMTGKKENRKILVLRSICGTIGIVCNYYAVDRLVLSDANMLNKLSPFLVIIFCALFLKEKINLTQISIVTVAFIGVLFIIKPTFQVEIFPYLVGVLGSVFAALAYTCVRVLRNKEDYYTIVFFFSTFSLIAILPMFVAVYKPMDSIQVIYLILAGIFASIGQFGVTLAYKYAPAKEISIYDYSGILCSAILGMVFFSEVPDMFSVLGYIIIFSAAFYMFLYNKKLDNSEADKNNIEKK